MKLRMRPAAFAQEIKAEFVSFQGAVFDSEVVRRQATAKPEAPQPASVYYAGLDLAMNRDFNVLTIGKMVDGRLRVVLVDRWNKIDAPASVSRVLRTCNRYRVSQLAVDGTGLGLPIVDMLRQKGDVPVVPFSLVQQTKAGLIGALGMLLDQRAPHDPCAGTLPRGGPRTHALFVRLRDGRPIDRGAAGGHDDCVLSLALLASFARPGTGGAPERSSAGRTSTREPTPKTTKPRPSRSSPRTTTRTATRTFAGPRGRMPPTAGTGIAPEPVQPRVPVRVLQPRKTTGLPARRRTIGRGVDYREPRRDRGSWLVLGRSLRPQPMASATLGHADPYPLALQLLAALRPAGRFSIQGHRAELLAHDVAMACIGADVGPELAEVREWLDEWAVLGRPSFTVRELEVKRAWLRPRAPHEAGTAPERAPSLPGDVVECVARAHRPDRLPEHGPLLDRARGPVSRRWPAHSTPHAAVRHFDRHDKARPFWSSQRRPLAARTSAP